mgnify:CR=1 FL=1
MIIDIISWIALPHILAFFLLFRLSMFEIRPKRGDTFWQGIGCLWIWVRPRWRVMVAHPLYWAATGIVSAYFLAGTLRSIQS